LYLDNKFYVSKCSFVLTDTYSIHYIIMLHVKVECRLTAINNRIFGPKREEITEDLRKVHNEKLHYFTAHHILFG